MRLCACLEWIWICAFCAWEKITFTSGPFGKYPNISNIFIPFFFGLKSAFFFLAWSLFLCSCFLTLVLLNPDMLDFVNSVDPSEEANWSGSALFIIQYLNLYQQPWSSNLTGWQLEVGVFSRARVIIHSEIANNIDTDQTAIPLKAKHAKNSTD